LRIPVLFFPEGTSTDGTMLRFHSRLFQPAIDARVPVTAACISYETSDRTPERNLCWFGDDTFAPHLLRTLRTQGIQAKLRFGNPRLYSERRTAADETFQEIAAMRAGAKERDTEALQLV
jgi:1-acyl-sn-glycerol-3-phosphate acyltransferase